MRLIIIKSILGQKEKSKIENKIKVLLDPIDLNRWFVVNEIDRDYLLIDISYVKSSNLEFFFREIGVLIDSIDVNLDDILDKINTNGVKSLHEYERIYLNEYK